MNEYKNGLKVRKKKIIGLSIFIILLSIIILLSSLVAIGKYYGRKKEKIVRQFLSRVIDSINENTLFYKENSSEKALEEIQNDIDKISKDYEITVIDYDPGYYEYQVTFNKSNKIYAVVMQQSGTKNFKLMTFIFEK